MKQYISIIGSSIFLIILLMLLFGSLPNLNPFYTSPDTVKTIEYKKGIPDTIKIDVPVYIEKTVPKIVYKTKIVEKIDTVDWFGNSEFYCFKWDFLEKSLWDSTLLPLRLTVNYPHILTLPFELKDSTITTQGDTAYYNFQYPYELGKPSGTFTIFSAPQQTITRIDSIEIKETIYKQYWYDHWLVKAGLFGLGFYIGTQTK